MCTNGCGQVDAESRYGDKRERNEEEGRISQGGVGVIVVHGGLQIVCEEGDGENDGEADYVSIVQQRSWVKLKVAHDAFDGGEIGGCECVVEEDERVAGISESYIAQGGHEGAKRQYENRHDDWKGVRLVEHEVLGGHDEEHCETSKCGEHWDIDTREGGETDGDV